MAKTFKFVKTIWSKYVQRNIRCSVSYARQVHVHVTVLSAFYRPLVSEPADADEMAISEDDDEPSDGEILEHESSDESD